MLVGQPYGQGMATCSHAQRAAAVAASSRQTASHAQQRASQAASRQPASQPARQEAARLADGLPPVYLRRPEPAKSALRHCDRGWRRRSWAGPSTKHPHRAITMRATNVWAAGGCPDPAQTLPLASPPPALDTPLAPSGPDASKSGMIWLPENEKRNRMAAASSAWTGGHGPAGERIQVQLLV